MPTPRPLHILVLVIALLNQIVSDAIEPLGELKFVVPLWNAPLKETARLLWRHLKAGLDFVGVRLPRRARWCGLTSAALLLRGWHDPVRNQEFEEKSLVSSSLFLVRETAGSQC